MSEMIHLGKTDRYVLPCNGQNLRVENGSVLVFLEPHEGEEILRRQLVLTAAEGDIIPAPVEASVKGAAGAERTLHVILIAEGEADLVLTEDAGAQEAQAFWQNAYANYTAWEDERRDAVQKRKEDKETTRRRTLFRMQTIFKPSLHFELASLEKTGSLIYDAAAFLGKRKSVTVAGYQTIRTAAGDDFFVEDIARISGFPCRRLELPEHWTKQVEEPFLGTLQDEEKERVVVVFHHLGRFQYFDPETGDVQVLKAGDAAKVDPSVYVFDRPLPQKKINFKDILQYCRREIALIDFVIFLCAMFLLSQVGTHVSSLSQMIFDQGISSEDLGLVYGLGVIFLSVLAANFLFMIAKNMTNYRLTSNISTALTSAILDRAFHMPEKYYRGKESAEQAYRVYHMAETYVMVLQNGWTVVMELTFGLFYLHRMHQFSPLLAHIGEVVAALEMILTVIFGLLSKRYSRERSQNTGKIRSFLYQAVTGISTIRVGSAEEDVLARYMDKCLNLSRIQMKSDRFGAWNSVTFGLVNALCTVAMYQVMGNGSGIGITLGVFMGFLSANAMFSASVLQATNAGSSIFTMIPVLKDTGEILKTVPERGNKGQILTDFKGEIVLSDVSYAYEKGQKNVLENISLKIQEGEYVGIVGHSGCGKSTLMRLMLGFERPVSGEIYYDDVPTDRLNMPELRRKMGIVLQDGSLVSGTIYQNIQIAHPTATEEEVKAAVSMACLTEDIQELPMGLLTYVSDDALTLSGGQKQRILIARAVLSSPKVLLFDEATSSLDNNTQEIISEKLSHMNATRVVIAHRLSTVRECDRILVMDQGKIIEEGNFETLMEKEGKFYEMVKVQQAFSV